MSLATKFVAVLVAMNLALLLACSNSSSPTSPLMNGSQLDIGICAPGAGGFSADLTNPFFPLPVGARWVLEGTEDGELLRLVVTSLPNTELVAGVTTRVIEEHETVGGELVEISRNFYAQASDGTVCYYGEDVDIYEGGAVVSHMGAWRAGGGNQPGIFVPGTPRLGQQFQQEVAPGVALDEATIIGVGETVQVPFGTFSDTIRYEDRNPLDGDVGQKVFARGVGLVIDSALLRIE